MSVWGLDAESQLSPGLSYFDLSFCHSVMGGHEGLATGSAAPPLAGAAGCSLIPLRVRALAQIGVVQAST